MSTSLFTVPLQVKQVKSTCTSVPIDFTQQNSWWNEGLFRSPWPEEAFSNLQQFTCWENRPPGTDKKIIIKNVIVWVMSRHKSIFPEETSRSLHRGITCSLSLRNLIPLQEGMSEKCFPSLNPLPPHLTDLSGTKSTTDSFASGYGICGNGNQHQGHTSPQSTRLM